jgi:radical SAM superfamily enzyme YgiQ (UPF0313 family)
MRIVLLYPPPWKIPQPGETIAPRDGGPPAELREGDLDADLRQIPHGLLSLAAQAMRAGHQVKVLNLSAFAWAEVERAVEALDADLFGLSCFTANRRGVALVARLVRERHPRAHIVVGGPHATALAVEMLEHHRDIDTVAVGEGEQTLLDLATRLERGEPTAGTAGTAYRDAGRVALGPQRPRIADLDSLASVHDTFATHVVMTSRGCPMRCSFCAKNAVWGGTYGVHSVPWVLDALERALARLPVKMLMIKDDTFTANRKRALELCRAIRARGLRVLWSCDTRADVLGEQLVREMRLAGCERLSLGVESGSKAVLERIGKGVTPARVREATALARSVGLKVRFYMMLGNRGETASTFRESLELVRASRPHQALFACLSVYPGTRDFADLVRRGDLDPEVFFQQGFQELKMPFDASDEDTRLMADWFEQHRGVQELHEDGVDELRAVLERLGDHHAAHMDLAGAYVRAGELGRAEHHAGRALELGYPAPGLAHNMLACIAAARGDWRAMEASFVRAAVDPQHFVLQRNVVAVRAWLARGGPRTGPPPKLLARHDFQILERTEQPCLPGPLPHDFARWP